MHFAKTTGQKWLQIALDWHAVGLRRLFSKSWSVEIVGHFLESMGGGCQLQYLYFTITVWVMTFSPV